MIDARCSRPPHRTTTAGANSGARAGVGHRRGRARTLVALAGCAAMGWPAVVDAATATFSWTANTEPNLAGYKLYYDIDSGDPYEGTHSSNGPSPVDIPLAALSDPDNPEFTLTGLPSCEHFYFALTAYDDQQLESDYSEEVEDTVMVAADPVTATAAGSGELLLGWEPPPWDDLGSIPLYRIYFDTDSGEPYEGPGSPMDVPASSLNDEWDPDLLLTGLTNGTTYYFMIESECADQTTMRSEEVSGTPSDPGTGGTGATGGSGGTGGTGASGTTGGSSATGGTGAAGTGGEPAQGGAGPGLDESNEESGCSCRVGPNRSSRPAVAVLGLLAGLFSLRRRRRWD